jgi:hypothetical protein
MSKSANSIATIEQFLQAVKSNVKYAAEAHTEPGSIGGATTHPVKDVDDSTEEASEGDRSAENTADVKADQGKPSVDSTSDNIAAKKAAAKRAVDGKSEDGSVNPPGTAAGDQLQIGTKKQPTGEDPGVETGSAKAEKEDAAGGRLGNTSHPARTNNGELDGYKYASMSIEKLSSYTAQLGNELLAQLALLKKAELTGAQGKLDVNNNGKIDGSDLSALRSGEKSDDDDDDDDEKSAVDAASQAGWELAGLLSGNFDKKAADALVSHSLEQIIKVASDDADKVASFLTEYTREIQKQAMGEMPGGIDPAAMGGGGAPGMDPGMDPAMAAGGPPGDAAAMAGGGEADIEQLIALLEQLGISPEELEAAMAGGGAGGGMPPDAAGGTPPGAPAGAPPEKEKAEAAPGMEVEAHAKAAAAKKGAAKQQVRDYIQEVLSRSRS